MIMGERVVLHEVDHRGCLRSTVLTSWMSLWLHLLASNVLIWWFKDFRDIFLGNHKQRRWSLQATNKLCIQWKLSVPHEKCWLHGIFPPRLGTSGSEWVTCVVYHSFRVLCNHVAVEGNSTAHPNPSPLHQILYLYSQNPHIPGSKSKQVNQVEWENYDKLVCLLGLLHPKCLHCFFLLAIFRGWNSLTYTTILGWLTNLRVGPLTLVATASPKRCSWRKSPQCCSSLDWQIDKGKPKPVSKENPEVSPWWETGWDLPEMKIVLAPEKWMVGIRSFCCCDGRCLGAKC